MYAVIAERHGGPEVLTLAERPAPTPGPGELLVELAAAGVNFKDVYDREGRTGVQPPLILGSEGAGTILAAGPGNDGFRLGEHVAWWNAPRSYAEQVVVPADTAVPIPTTVSDQDAAGIILQGLTAHYLTTSTYIAQEGETALVHAAAGGLGQHLVRLLAHRHVHVIAAVSTDQKAAIAKAAGAQDVIVRNPAQTGAMIAEHVREMTNGHGVDVVYDGVGKDTFEASLASLRRRGTFVLMGAASGRVPPFDPQSLASHGSLFLTRPTLADHATKPDELAARANDVFSWLREGTLKSTIGGHYRFDQASRAHTALQARRTTGKLLLLPPR